MATTDVWADGSEWTWVDDAGVTGGGYWKNTKPSNDGQYAGRYWYDGAIRLSKPDAVSATKASQWTGQGPNGYGTYLLDGPGGTPGTWIGDPSKGSSGGTTVVNTNSTSAWSRITDPVTGDIYNYNEITGEKQLLFPGNKSAGTAGDANGDGYDDSTGLPNGVKSIGGKLYYQGVRVNPDGSPYTGDDGSGAPELVNGKYTWDAKLGKYVIAPGMESTSSSSSSANISVRTPASSYSSSSGSGGSGGTSIADQLAVISARSGANMSESQQDYELKRELMLLQFQLDNDPNNPELLLRKQQLAMQIEDAVGQRAKDYATAVSAVDPLAFAAIYQAHGGNVGNLIASGEDAISPRSLAAAAAIFNSIGQMRDRLTGLGASGGGGTYGGGLGVQPGVGTGVQPGISPGTGAGTGVATGGGTGTGAGTGMPGANQSGTDTGEGMWGVAQAITQAQLEEQRAYEAYHNPANWTLVPSQNLTYGGAGTGDRYTNNLTGERITAEQYAYLMATNGPQSEAEMMMGGLQDAEILRGQQPGAALDPNARLPFTQATATGSGGTTLYNMPWGWSTTNQLPSSSWQTGGDRGDLSRVITTDVGTPVAGAGGPILAQEPVNPNQTVMGPVAAYAEGTMAKPRGFGRNMAMLPSRSRGLAMPRALPPVPMRGEHLATDMHIVGDPKPGTNRPNPELVQWTPRGNRIIPANDTDLMKMAVPAWTPPQAPAQQTRYPAGMMSRSRGFGIPAYAWGSDVLSGGNQWGSMLPVQEDPLYIPPAAPTALATTEPVYTPSPVVTAPAPVVSVPQPIVTTPAPYVAPAPAPVVTSAPADLGAGTVVSTATTPSQSATSPAAVSPSPTAPAPVATTPAPTTTTALATADTTNPTTLPATAATPTVITISPEDQATMDMIRDLREGAYATRPDVSLYQSDYFNLDPTVRAVYEASLQAGKGIPVASSQFEAEKYRPRGFSRSQFALGV